MMDKKLSWREKGVIMLVSAFLTWVLYCLTGCSGAPKYLRNPPVEHQLYPENNKGPDRVTKYLDDQGNPIWVWE